MSIEQALDQAIQKHMNQAADIAAPPADQPAAPVAAPAGAGNTFLSAAGRTFANADDAAKHINASQAHIQKLETEAQDSRTALNDLTQKVAELASLKELLTQSTAAPAQQAQPAAGQPLDPVGTAQQAPMPSTEDLNKLVAQQVATLKQQDQSQINLQVAQQDAIKVLGESWASVVASKAVELNMTAAQAEKIAQENPAMFKALFVSKQNSPGYLSGGSTLSIAPVPQEQPVANANFIKMSASQQRKFLADKMAWMKSQM